MPVDVAGLDRVEAEQPGLEIGDAARPAAEMCAGSPFASRPNASACQSSTTPSLTTAPAPSMMSPGCGCARPAYQRTQACCRMSSRNVDADAIRRQADMHIGPGGLRRRFVQARVRHASIPGALVFEVGGPSPAQDDVEAIGETVERGRGIEIERCGQPIHCSGIRNGVGDGIVSKQGIALEIHLRDQSLCPSGAEQREMDVRRPPTVGKIPER